MMDREREKVIKRLEKAVEVFDGRISNPMFEIWMDGTKDALALLQAQEPVEPTIGRAVEHDGHDSWWYQCGKCEKPIDWQDNYCRHCGRKVKWK